MKTEARRSTGVRRGGFTLIELLVVCVIIGILIGILMPVLMKTKKKAKRQQANVEIRALETAIAAYRMETSAWPVTDPGGAERIYGNDNNMIVTLLTNAIPPLLAAEDFRLDGSGNVVDPWSAPYQFKFDKDFDGQFMGDSLEKGVDVSSINL